VDWRRRVLKRDTLEELQRFVYKGLREVTVREQGTPWPKTEPR
jgi:hypothetical protein